MKYKRSTKYLTWHLILGLMNIAVFILAFIKNNDSFPLWLIVGLGYLYSYHWGNKTPIATLSKDVFTWNRTFFRKHSIDPNQIINIKFLKPKTYKLTLSSGTTFKLFTNHFLELEAEDLVNKLKTYGNTK